MHALRLDIRQESFQTMCTLGHEHKNSGLDIRSSVIMHHSEYNIPLFDYSIIVSIPKKGSSLSLDDQRGIAMSCEISKLQNKILFNRIKSVTESNLLVIQSAFRSGRSTTEQITTFRFLLDPVRTQRRSLTVAFVDYGKTFDSVDRRAIPVVLRL